ncbi:MAG: hypothetical protein KAR54_00520 [Candidatus Pacebacteria bacterium]|nr:hypothetical protein [Candidatus Paceibacterota bacterium]
MTEERKNEIARSYLFKKQKLIPRSEKDCYSQLQDLVRKEGFGSFNPEIIQIWVGLTAKRFGIKIEEVQEFTHNLILPIAQEAFPMPK